MGEQQYLTSEGADRLRNELNQLKGPAREDLAKRLRSAIRTSPHGVNPHGNSCCHLGFSELATRLATLRPLRP